MLVVSSLSVTIMCTTQHKMNIMILWIRLEKQMSVFTPSQLIPVCWYRGGPCGWTYVRNIFISWLVEKRSLSNFIHIKLYIPLSIFLWCCARDFVYRHNHTSWHSSLNWKLTFWSQERRFFSLYTIIVICEGFDQTNNVKFVDIIDKRLVMYASG